MEIVRAEIHVHGRVQGVAYRASAARRGRQLGLVGYARNLDDGSVELVAEGDEASVTWFVAWCHEGPPLARVDRVEVEHGPARGDFERFEIA